MQKQGSIEGYELVNCVRHLAHLQGRRQEEDSWSIHVSHVTASMNHGGTYLVRQLYACILPLQSSFERETCEKRSPNQ